MDHSKARKPSTDGTSTPMAAGSAAGGQCPMGHDGPASADHTAAPGGSGAGECPMGHGKTSDGSSAAASGPVYNVYGQEVNPDNMMPWLAQKPAPGQRSALSTHRVQSSIPKGGTESETWLFPSPQQFYNALVRKNKAENVDEGDMGNVVAIHNAMNERAWKLLRAWETGFHKDELEPGCPKLRRFMGRPFELSPKARVKALLGMGEPFDRHDWYVDRGDGTEVRYILDYYFDEKAAEADTDPQSTKCIYVDVRPALDSPRAVLDRLLAFPGRALEAVTNFRTFANGSDPDAVPAKFSQALGGGGRAKSPDAAEETESSARAAAERLAALDRKCNPFRVRLAEAKDEESRSVAFVALTYCMGADSCKPEADAFLKAAEASSGQGTAESAAFEALHGCVVGSMEADLAAAKRA